jgi:hypothetical protein
MENLSVGTWELLRRKYVESTETCLVIQVNIAILGVGVGIDLGIQP